MTENDVCSELGKVGDLAVNLALAKAAVVAKGRSPTAVDAVIARLHEAGRLFHRDGDGPGTYRYDPNGSAKEPHE